jgi:hypothetical protein
METLVLNATSEWIQSRLYRVLDVGAGQLQTQLIAPLHLMFQDVTDMVLEWTKDESFRLILSCCMGIIVGNYIAYAYGRTGIDYINRRMILV